MLNGRCGLSLWKFLNCCTPKHLIYLEGYMTAVRNISPNIFNETSLGVSDTEIYDIEEKPTFTIDV